MSIVSQLCDYPAVKAYLFELKNKGVSFGIDRMRVLAGRLKHPECAYPIIHVAGTNGKGSTAAMIEAVLRKSGLKTGLFSSPHLVRQGERIQVNREILDEEEIVQYTRKLCVIAEEIEADDPNMHPSFFEFMTAIGMLHFERSRVDVAIFEVGLGGRLDATNVVTPEISVITSIGLDHCEILGYSLEKIAVEKAGVIKEGRPVVIGCLSKESEKVILEIASQRSAPVLSVREIFGDDVTKYPETNLSGGFQRMNAATATVVCQSLKSRFGLSDVLIQGSLKEIQWEGRWQEVKVGGSSLILDVSHNPDGAIGLNENLAHFVCDRGYRPKVVVGVLGKARARALLTVICQYASEVILVVPDLPRASSFEELEEEIPDDFKGKVSRSSLEEIFPSPNVFTVGSPTETVIITGSIYLIGNAMERMKYSQPVDQSMLQDW